MINSAVGARHWLSWLFFLAILLPVTAVAAARTHEFRLDNGLKVVVKEDHRAPVAVSQIWYKVGSSYEHEGITGISHLLEHMMFKGTAQHGPGEFSRIIAENGGRENAFTGYDYTAYFETLEKSRLPIAFELEADRMRNLLLDPKEFAREKQVVLEERRMRTDDQPHARTQEHFMAAAFTNGPYRNPVIGWPADIEALTVEDLRSWYRRWYVPDNATLVVVGDVDPQEVLELAKRWFGPLRAGDTPPLKPRTEVEQLGERRLDVKLPAQLPFLLMGYKVPVLASLAKESQWEAYALTVLAGVLDGGESARFSTRLIRGRQIAAAAGAGYDLYDRLPTLFMFSATPAQGRHLGELEEALRQEVRDLKEKPVSREELERVKAQVTAGAIYERDSMFYQAMQIGLLETVGLGWDRLDEYVARIRQVTAEQVQEVARKYLVPEHLTVARLHPLPIQGAQRPPIPAAVPGGNHVR